MQWKIYCILRAMCTVHTVDIHMHFNGNDLLWQIFVIWCVLNGNIFVLYVFVLFDSNFLDLLHLYYLCCAWDTLKLNAMPWKWLAFWELPLNSISMIKRCAEKENPEKIGTHSKYGKIHFIKLNVFCLFGMNVYVCVSERNRKRRL